MANRTILKVNELTKSYEGKIVVNKLSLEIGAGEILGLLGPNGAGKTTTIGCLLAAIKPTAGSIEIFGKKTDGRNPPDYSKIGVQFQESHYPDRIRVDEVLRMFGALYPQSEEIDCLLSRFGLLEKKKAEVAKLSGGQRQKLSLALALLNKPQLVFLDELTTGLDPQARREVWGSLKQLKDQGLTILLTTHYLEEAAYLCDQIILINNGFEVVRGTPDQLIRETGSPNLEEVYFHYINKEDAV